ncbi:MAG: carboxypeptidase regulatory-like domain-containing protein [Elusimicrobia bacterium]|nr:carboxypeptidase regulatory-like domain-containing protein [Elusimicrobiota bacterium]
MRKAGFYLALLLLAVQASRWVGPHPSLYEFAPFPPASWVVQHAGLSLLIGLLGALCLRASPGYALAGSILGLFPAFLGLCARLWLEMTQAGSLLGSAVASLIMPAIPWALLLCCALWSWAWMRPIRTAVITAALLACAWALPPAAGLAWLGWRWDFGPRDLSEAAGLARPSWAVASALTILHMRPVEKGAFRVELLSSAWNGLELSRDNLEAIERYWERRDGRTVFARQALKALRHGWLLWKEEGRALDAAMRHLPGIEPPDYRLALGLIYASPITPDNLGKLEELAELARMRPDGFERVLQSQYIFEAFASAFARYGDEAGARQWLRRIDGLWPLYEKKIEVAPLETFRDGWIEGRVIRRRSAAWAKVVLFHLQAEEATLSASFRLDPSGRFRFSGLGSGSYYLALLADGQQLSGPLHPSPGAIELNPEQPTVVLPPIVAE